MLIDLLSFIVIHLSSFIANKKYSCCYCTLGLKFVKDGGAGNDDDDDDDEDDDNR